MRVTCRGDMSCIRGVGRQVEELFLDPVGSLHVHLQASGHIRYLNSATKHHVWPSCFLSLLQPECTGEGCSFWVLRRRGGGGRATPRRTQVLDASCK
jgi:hypothetical protein